MKAALRVLLLLAACYSSGRCQSVEPIWYIAPQLNLYYPHASAEQGVFPILWYDKETDPKLLVGGLGVSAVALYPVKEKFSLKGQAGLARHSYWDKAIFITNANGQALTFYYSNGVDYILHTTATLQYHLSPAFMLGTGLGAHSMLVSLAKHPTLPGTDESLGFFRKRAYKPVLPVLPAELSFKRHNLLLSLRYEYSLLNKLKGDLRRHKTEKYHLLTFEAGFLLH